MSETCRICLQSDSAHNLISPCNCSGSQKYVHQSCVRQWQSAALKKLLTNPSPSGYSQVFNCTVCKLPLSLSESADKARFLVLSDSIQHLLCRCAWPMALYILFFSVTVAVCGLICSLLLLFLTFCAVYFLLERHDLRISVKRQSGGYRLSLIRSSSPVKGLRAGIVLKSTSRISSGIFHNSEVLVTHYTAGQPAQGLILNKSINTPGRGKIRVGGPVKPGTAHVLHSVSAVTGSVKVCEGVYLGGTVPASAAQEVFQGSAVWCPYQLDGEIKHGNWELSNLMSFS